MFDLLKKTPVGLLAALLAAQLATMIPFLAPGKIRPLFFVYLDEISLLDLTPTICFAVGHAMALAALLLIAKLAIAKWQLGAWGLRTVAVLVTAHFLCMTVGALYYTNFGQYPRFTLIQDLMITPGSVIGYGISGGTPTDLVFGLLSATVVIVIMAAVLRFVHRQSAAGDACFLAIAMAVAVLSVGTSIVNSRDSLGAFRVSQYHGTPTSLLWTTLSESVGHRPENQPEWAQRNLPVRLASHQLPEIERPIHIVLVVMETFRADHVPLYGYPRNTMPNLLASQQDWIVYENYRSAAPMTAASMRSMMSSRYLQLGSNENLINECVSQFWDSITAAGYKTAFMTGADMRWHYLDKVTQANECDHYLHLGAVDQRTRSEYRLRDRSDGSLNDTLVIQRTSELLREWDERRQLTFSMLYLMNLHQPYHSDPEDRKFSNAALPNIVADKRILDMELSADHRIALNNQYDNSIVNFDKNLADLVESMRHDGLLEKSVILVTGDHGEAFGEHGTYYHGTTVYDEQIKVPLMVRVGAELPKLRQALAANRTAVATGVDLSPTILSMAGSEVPEMMEGTPLTSSDRKCYDFVFWTAGYQMAAVFTQRMKYIYDMETRIAQGYDLLRDPSESNNLVQQSFGDFAGFLSHLERTGVLETHPAGASEAVPGSVFHPVDE